MQSMGSDHRPDRDRDRLGPEAGWICWHNLEIYNLKSTLWDLVHRGALPECLRWFNRWLLHLDFVMNAYEELRLKHKALYLYANSIVEDHHSVIGTLYDVLEQYDNRVAAAVEVSGEAT
eukprot:TRINITY_DN23753_c0_g2_i1.p3 TRINITY_DN23753_c0_g2~~TRINITY_DN23753_c0_g2_i1.p3  ORF type:complete len:119 (+),score=29.10 TRINITY_DN23753_c0_g2_i1:437-793(+)